MLRTGGRLSTGWRPARGNPKEADAISSAEPRRYRAGHELHERRRARSGQPVRRRRDRRRPQRPRGGRAAGQVRAAGRGAGAQGHRRWGRRDGDPVGARLQDDGTLLRHEPDAADHPSGARAGAARLPDPPAGALLRAVRGRPSPAAPGRSGGPPQGDLQVLRPRRRRHRGVGRLADRPGRSARPDAVAGAAEGGVQTARRPARPVPPGLALSRGRRRHGGRSDAAVHVQHRRPARRPLREPAAQGRPRRQRRHRHLGRAAVAGHRLRDGAPQGGGRRRRRPAGRVGVPGGRHGCGDERRCRPPRRASGPRCARTPPSTGSWSSAVG